MKTLLIIGAGGHGKVVAEIASTNGYDKVAFLDDNSSEAIGKINELERFKDHFEEAFVEIGNNVVRKELICKLENTGYEIPVLIHPTAYISKSAEISAGTVIEPHAVVNANSIIGKGCIVSVGAIVDHNSVLQDYVHVNAGAIISAGANIKTYKKVEAGKVIPGYGINLSVEK